DIDSWARFAAFITICRTTHFDVSHNWRLYFDPARGRFEPIVWDPVGWYYKGFVPYIEKQSNRMDVITSFVFELLHSDQRFLAAKHAAVEEFFSSGGVEFLEGLMDSTERLEASASRDRNMLINSVQLYSPSEALREMESFKQKTRESLEEVRSAYTGPPTGSYSVGRDGKIQVNVKGFPPIKYLEVEYGSPTGDLFSASVSFLKDGRVFSRDVTPQTALEGRTVRAEAPLFARRAMEFPSSANTLVIIKDAVIKPASYVFDFKGVKGPVLSVRAGYAEGRVAALEHAAEEAGQGLYPLDGNYGIIPVAEPEKTLAWSGDVVVDGVMEVDGGLEIASGTKVSFTPGSSLVVRGRLTAVGTAQRPVVFAPAKGGALPWGAVVLTGEKAGGSVLRHCVFSGGSGLRHRHVEYSAMLSIHGVEGVEIDNCLFSDNKIVDD
ncbi:MAG: hypothetical protein Q8P48_11655, partial [Deltaproteobacteria bacterium]|nr:hypothetical protein [Deltaproteobacteria bacterium]